MGASAGSARVVGYQLSRGGFLSLPAGLATIIPAASMTASWRFGLHMGRVIWSVCVVVRYCAFGCGGRAVDLLLYRSTHGHAQLLFAPV